MKPLRLISFFLLCAYAGSVCAEPTLFGRIFTSDEERERLDRARKSGEDLQAELGPEVAKLAETKYQRIEFSGYILDDEGKSVVWVNGKSDVSGKPAGIITSAPRSNRDDINVIHQGKRERLKPGQAWLLDNGVVKEVYEISQPKKVTKEPVSAAEPEEALNDAEKALELAEKVLQATGAD